MLIGRLGLEAGPRPQPIWAQPSRPDIRPGLGLFKKNRIQAVLTGFRYFRPSNVQYQGFLLIQTHLTTNRVISDLYDAVLSIVETYLKLFLAFFLVTHTLSSFDSHRRSLFQLIFVKKSLNYYKAKKFADKLKKIIVECLSLIMKAKILLIMFKI